MSLPEKPLTRREVYLAKAAGQEVTLPDEDITREELYLRAIAEGGGGGGVTPEYVAEAIAEAKTDIEAEIPTKTSDLTNDSGFCAIDDTTAAQNKAYSSAKVEEKVAGEEITTTATGSDLTLSTAQGNLNALTVYGKSEVVDGAIVSAGEGWKTVDLGTLNWAYYSSSATPIFYAGLSQIDAKANSANMLCPLYTPESGFWNEPNNDMKIATSTTDLFISNSQYTNPAVFKTAMNGVILAYEEATPTNNTIAIKTDDGSGINGTMAMFTTGTPLRGIPDSNVRDVMAWDGSAGTVTKNCGEVDLETRIWTEYGSTAEYTRYVTGGIDDKVKDNGNCLCAKYNSRLPTQSIEPNMVWISNGNAKLSVTTNVNEYASASDFAAAMSGVKLVYELSTPTTEQLTSTENASIASLRTYEPQTHAQNNAQTDMTVEAYAGTANGKAVNELKQDVQSEISALKITQSDTLTLTTAGWTNNAQTITYAHDTAKRNVIDVDPASVEEWASCGVLATAETASGITFTCKTVPENALTFRVTSMGVN